MCYGGVTSATVSYLLFDPLPDDSGHFVAVNVDYNAGNFDFFEGGERAHLYLSEHFYFAYFKIIP